MIITKQKYNELIAETICLFSKLNNKNYLINRNILNSIITTTKIVPEIICQNMDKILMYESKDNIYVQLLDITTKKIYNTSTLFCYKGDITKLKVDAIVNAGNSALLGCFVPDHMCVDNIIHCKAGCRMRNECVKIMIDTIATNGSVIITKAYNLPSNYVFHAVGPNIINNNPTKENKNELYLCYWNSLDLCEKNNLKSIAFTNISTGLFGYPIDLATNVAMTAVYDWLQKKPFYNINIVFCTFTDENYKEYLKYFY